MKLEYLIDYEYSITHMDQTPHNNVLNNHKKLFKISSDNFYHKKMQHCPIKKCINK